MARRVAFFAGLAALALAGLIASVPSVRGAEGSGTFVVISDFHFNPFDPPELATALARSAPAAWQATFTAAKDQAMSRTGEDTNPRTAGLKSRPLRESRGECGFRHRGGRFSGS
jgi:hypothetical protein